MTAVPDNRPDTDRPRDQAGPLASEVWLLKGVTYNHAGRLVLEGDRLRLYLTRLFGGLSEEPAFDLAAADVVVEIPRLYAKTGMKLHADDDTYRLSFLPPVNAAGSVADVARTISQFLRARKLCPAWQAALAGPEAGDAEGLLAVLRTTQEPQEESA